MNTNGHAESQQSLLLIGGLALMTIGAGMVLTSPVVRRTLFGDIIPRLFNSEATGKAISGLLPDVERYFKMKAM